MTQTPKDAWSKIREATPARVGLGRSGSAMLTDSQLAFQFAHARARDAVHRQVDFEILAQELGDIKSIRAKSQATDRATYLRRPDLGRQLHNEDIAPLREFDGVDIAIVVGDGLSSDAVQSHAASVVRELVRGLSEFRLSPVILASQARVAIGDEIAQAMQARLVIMLIGERPGLTVADSLGGYVTFNPQQGRKDSERNCVSNIHDKGGLSYEMAAQKIIWLSTQALKLQLSGTGLKEDVSGGLLQG